MCFKKHVSIHKKGRERAEQKSSSKEITRRVYVPNMRKCGRRALNIHICVFVLGFRSAIARKSNPRTLSDCGVNK